MEVNVRSHLPARITGIKDEMLKIELPDEMPLREFLSLLGRKYPSFANNFLRSLEKKDVLVPLLVMINRKASRLEQVIKDGDDIELFLVAAGGSI